LVLVDGAASEASLSSPYRRLGSDAEIYVMNAEGSNPTNVTNEGAEDSYPAWSPDGSKIAFTSFRGQFGNPDVFVMDPDGSDLVNITDDIAEDFDPAWSPDYSILVDPQVANTGGITLALSPA
jgi:Tol biopolymer transport system component